MSGDRCAVTGWILAAVVLAAVPVPLAAQGGPPASDIYLAPLTWVDGVPRVGHPRNITARRGYDNQPAFTPDGRAILYTSIREDGQADVYRYLIGPGDTEPVIGTAPESEYSPTVMPDGDGISVIRVEADSTQRLWAFYHDERPPAPLSDLRPVGYYTWLDGGRLAFFVLTDPFTLQLTDTSGAPPVILAGDIGRTVARVPGQNLAGFVQRAGDTLWLATADPETHQVARLVQLPGTDFFAWMPDGSAVAGQDGRVLRWRSGAGGWNEIADLAAHGIRGITRMAVSADGNYLAIVASAP